MKPLHKHIVLLATALGSEIFSYTNVEHGLRILVLTGTAVYVWRRALKKKLPKEKDLDDWGTP